MNKGFTLVELMVVIVIMAIITMIGYTGITAVQQNIKENLWDGKVDAILSGAEAYGEDNKNLLTGTCSIDGSNVSNCTSLKVDDLIKSNYVPTDEERCVEYDENSNCINSKETIINESVPEDDPNYYANDLNVYIYLENNVVYAVLEGD